MISEEKNIEKLNLIKGFSPFMRKKGKIKITVGLYNKAIQKIAPDKMYLFFRKK